MGGIFGSTPLPKICTKGTFRGMKTETATSAITRACNVFGSQQALAKAVDVAPAQVSQWVNDVRPVPARYCVAIERETSAQVTCEQLLPNERWLRVADPNWPHPDGRPCLDMTAPLPA